MVLMNMHLNVAHLHATHSAQGALALGGIATDDVVQRHVAVDELGLGKHDRTKGALSW